MSQAERAGGATDDVTGLETPERDADGGPSRRPKPLRHIAPPPPGSARERRAELLVAGAFAVTMLSGAALFVLYIAGGMPFLEGLLLALCLGGLGLGIVVWSRDLMSVTVLEEPRKPIGHPGEAAHFAEVLADEAGFSRRRLLLLMLLGALGGLGAALLLPAFSLGPEPGQSLFRTAWRSGSRVVGTDGEPVRADDVVLGGVLTVFPDGSAGSADSQALLIRVEPELLQLPPERADWAPGGFVAYSKLCTHAGCPVGLYRAGTHQLVCPCHQSTFDVLKGAVPTAGPAVRPLPQLPITLQPDGTFVAVGDFPEPVGPSFWNMGR